MRSPGSSTRVNGSPSSQLPGGRSAAKPCLEAGTALSVRLRPSRENPCLKSATATVEDGDAFEATFDLTDVPEGTTFQVVVTRNGTRVVDTTGEIVE